jgi:hypothetical protein
VPVEMRFQQPGVAQGNLLNDLIALAAEARSGGGIFAWTNEAGVAAALAHEEFGRLLGRGAFDLVVGIDSITTVGALAALDRVAARSAGLSVRVFLNESDALFHPKFAWFDLGDDEIAVVVGSGNLTNGGLQRNWEIQVLARLQGDERARVQEQIAAWHAAHAGDLVATDDPRVLDRARRNSRADEATLLRRRAPAPPPPRVADADGVRVLVAEPTYSKQRVGQANFDLAAFEGFFGARRGVDSFHVFSEVDASGSVVRTGPVKAVTSKTSNNFRFELHFAGATYTRPYAIGVFVRLGVSTEFVYQMLAPGDTGYDELSLLLDRVAGPPRGTRHRQREVTADELAAAWPDAPVFRASVPPA